VSPASQVVVHEVAFRFEKHEALGGQATLVQDGVVVGTGAVERFTPVAFNEVMVGLTCGYEWGAAVGSCSGERLRGTLHLQWHHRPGGGDTHRSRGARSGGGGDALVRGRRHISPSLHACATL
jgi:hypothetical protein